jgi:hypothetical protein
MNENLTKAVESAAFLIGDLQAAWSDANSIDRPEGRSVGDRVLLAYLGDCLEMARKLQSQLLRISDQPTPPATTEMHT